MYTKLIKKIKAWAGKTWMWVPGQERDKGLITFGSCSEIDSIMLRGVLVLELKVRGRNNGQMPVIKKKMKVSIIKKEKDE